MALLVALVRMNAMRRPSGEKTGPKSACQSGLGGVVSRRVSVPSISTSQSPNGSEADGLPPIATHFPSGLHESLVDLRELSRRNDATRRSAPPRAGITKTSNTRSGMRRTNAIRCPSGDHAGLSSRSGALVSRTGSPVPTSFTYTSWLSSRGPFQEKATWFPSGDRLGPVSLPG